MVVDSDFSFQKPFSIANPQMSDFRVSVQDSDHYANQSHTHWLYLLHAEDSNESIADFLAPSNQLGAPCRAPGGSRPSEIFPRFHRHLLSTPQQTDEFFN